MWQQFAVLLLAIAVLFLRRPGDLIHAQFYAEDGRIWFAQAYNGGWLHSLFRANTGYIDTLPRLTAGAALLVPLQRAPLVLNLVGAMVQALPVVALLNKRARTWGPFSIRVCMAALYLLLPNVDEVHVTVTNSPWHLAVLALLVGMFTPPKTRLEGVTDLAVMLLAATSGPYVLMIAPLLFIYWFAQRSSWTLLLAGICAVGVAVQVHTLLFHVRVAPELGATVPLFVRILGGQCFLDTLVGSNSIVARLPLIAPVLGLVVGLAIVYFGSRAAPLPMRLLTFFCFVMFGLGLRKPASDADHVWMRLSLGVGDRYFFYVTLAFAWCLLWCYLRAEWSGARRLALGALCLLPIGLIHNFRHKNYQDFHYRESVARFESARPGETVQIAIPPSWSMGLVKHDVQASSASP